MARIIGKPPFIGTKHGICIYKMHGEYYARAASSLEGKTVKKAPAFKATREWAATLKAASRLGGAVYDMLPPSQRKHRRYRELTGQAMRLLRAGNTEGETVVALLLSIRPKKRIRHKKPRPVLIKQALKTAPAAARRTATVHRLYQKRTVFRRTLSISRLIFNPSQEWHFVGAYGITPSHAPP